MISSIPGNEKWCRYLGDATSDDDVRRRRPPKKVDERSDSGFVSTSCTRLSGDQHCPFQCRAIRAWVRRTCQRSHQLRNLPDMRPLRQFDPDIAVFPVEHRELREPTSWTKQGVWGANAISRTLLRSSICAMPLSQRSTAGESGHFTDSRTVTTQYRNTTVRCSLNMSRAKEMRPVVALRTRHPCPPSSCD